MTTAQVVETSVTVNNNSPIQDYVHPDDQIQTLKAKTYQWVDWIACLFTTVVISFPKAY